MPTNNYAEFIAVCRSERASLIGLIEAIQGRRMDPGAPIDIPPDMVGATDAALKVLESALTQLQALIDAYEAVPRPS